MKPIKISSKLINLDGDETIVDTTGNYDEENKILEYNEDELSVRIKLLNKAVIISRKNDDYDLNLEFRKNTIIKCKYIVKSIGINYELDVYTDELSILENELKINYKLYNEKEHIGTFEYNLMFKEW